MAELEPKLSAYYHSKGIKLGIPVSGTFELTRRCNFNCKMCYVHSCGVTDEGELGADFWLKTASDAKKAGTLFLLLTGGEPLLRSDFSYIYKEISKMGFVVSINSNGSLINDEILSVFEEYPPNRINISLYGGSEETYFNLCGNRKFYAVVDNVKKLKKIGLSVRLTSVFNSANVNDIDKVYDIAKELGVIVKPTSYMYPSLRAKGEIGENSVRLDACEAGKCVVRFREYSYSESDMLSRAEELLALVNPECDRVESEGGIRCRAGRSAFWVTFDGKMLPCGMMAEPGVSLVGADFNGVWASIREKAAQIRSPKECADCKYNKLCNVCPAMCYAETGSFVGKPQYICDMTDAIVKQYKNLI